MHRLSVIDSHTAGEPTRLVLEGGPDLGSGPLEERARRFAQTQDCWRSAIVNEPRGSDVMVGAMLVPPHRADCTIGVIFFNNVGLLGMCGHGTIGVVASLAHAGRLRPGPMRIDTPVGAVAANLLADGAVEIVNVPSYRHVRDVSVQVPGRGEVRGDIAWGGNWFFLTEAGGHELDVGNIEQLTEFSWRVRQAVNTQVHADVDHVELFATAQGDADSRNFVLCPGKAWDRSPCGTGTSAKLACLAADGQLAEGEEWIQQSIIGSHFRARYRWLDRARGLVSPTIVGSAWITAETCLLLDPADPYRWGIR